MATKVATKTILQKLQEARDIVKSLDTKKDGTNEYSKYDYYTPEIVESLVREACKKTKTICLCSLRADEYGLFQTLIFHDLESNDALDFELRTKHGSLKATNETQQMGGTDTYSERYIKMKVFQIKDNLLDFDSQDHREKKYDNTPPEVAGTCKTCGNDVIKSKYPGGDPFYCFTCKSGKKEGEVNANKTPYHKKLEGQLDLPTYEDELDALELNKIK